MRMLSEYVEVHPLHPKPRLIEKGAKALLDGGVIIYPTDSMYALGCKLGNKSALTRICRIRKLDERHQFTLICGDISTIAKYAVVQNNAYHILRTHTPGAYTFILKAKHRVPRHVMYAKRKTIGIRVPDSSVARLLIDKVAEPILTTSLILPNTKTPIRDPAEIRSKLSGDVDLILAAGECGSKPTSVVNLVEGMPVVEREGLGETASFKC